MARCNRMQQELSASDGSFATELSCEAEELLGIIFYAHADMLADMSPYKVKQMSREEHSCMLF